MNKIYVISFLCGLLGALLPTLWEKKDSAPVSMKSESVITAQRIDLVDSSGQLRGQLGFSNEGTPAFWLFDKNGKSRLSFGIYADNSAYFGLQDKQENMIQLFRSYGPKEAPLQIFKMNGSDQMIIGLNPAASAAEPFIMYYDPTRTRTLPFGKYDGP